MEFSTTQTGGRVGGLSFALAGGRNKRERSLFLEKTRIFRTDRQCTPFLIRMMGRARAV